MQAYRKLGVADRQALRPCVLGPMTPRLTSASAIDDDPAHVERKRLRIRLQVTSADPGMPERSLADARERAAAAGLSPREQQVAVLAALGRSNHEIASELTTSPNTVKDQLAAIYRKMKVDGRDRLAAALLGCVTC